MAQTVVTTAASGDRSHLVPTKKGNAEDGALVLIPIAEIGSHPDQPRTQLSRERQKELKSSLVKTRGLMAPIEVRPSTAKELKADPQFPYRLISGQRRLEAYRELYGEAQSNEERALWASIRAIVKLGVDEHDALERSLIENIQREELLPLDEAEAYARIKRNRDLKGAKDVAMLVGKKEERVKDLLRLHEAPEVIKEALRTGLKVMRYETGEAADTEVPKERRETLRRLDVGEALRFTQLFEHYFEKHGGRNNRAAAGRAAEATRNAIERALTDGWGFRRVDEYVKAVKAGSGSEAAPRIAPLFKADEKQFVLYRQRLSSASQEEKARAREALTEVMALLA
jgi:ParB/RepB/Spo0J family partition protein